MYEAESLLVNEDYLKNDNVYNVKIGGMGGWDHQNKISDIQKLKNKKSQIKQKWLRENNPNYMDNVKMRAAETMKRLHREGKIKYDTFTGKNHTEETKYKIGIANSKLQQGSNNSNFGNIWVYNIIEKKSICVKENDLEEWLKKGWVKGRKIKW